MSSFEFYPCEKNMELEFYVGNKDKLGIKSDLQNQMRFYVHSGESNVEECTMFKGTQYVWFRFSLQYLMSSFLILYILSTIDEFIHT